MISLIFSALPDVFWYSILYHHPLCLLLSLSSCPVYLSFCLIRLSASPIFFFLCNPVTYLFFISCLSYLPVSSPFPFSSNCASVIITSNIPCHALGDILYSMYMVSFTECIYFCLHINKTCHVCSSPNLCVRVSLVFHIYAK